MRKKLSKDEYTFLNKNSHWSKFFVQHLMMELFSKLREDIFIFEKNFWLASLIANFHLSRRISKRLKCAYFNWSWILSHLKTFKRINWGMKNRSLNNYFYFFIANLNEEWNNCVVKVEKSNAAEVFMFMLRRPWKGFA